MTETLTADVVVPDGIEPLLLARSWLFDGTHLRSPQQTNHVWMPGEPFRATCTQTRSGWWVERGRGCTRERAAALHGNANAAPPTVELPPGFGYVWEERPLHDGCPGECCTCGVYGTHDEESIIGTFGERRLFDPHPPSGFPNYISRHHHPEGVIVGSVVALWGKVIEGEKGARAEFGYPVLLDVPESLGDSDALRAYGVPVNVLPSPASDAPVPGPGLPPIRKPFWTQRKVYAFTVGANLGACAVNLSHLAGLW